MTDQEWAAALTASDVELMLHAALREHDMPAVVSCLHLMAGKNPHRAQMLLDIVDLAVSVGGIKAETDPA